MLRFAKGWKWVRVCKTTSGGLLRRCVKWCWEKLVFLGFKMLEEISPGCGCDDIDYKAF